MDKEIYTCWTKGADPKPVAIEVNNTYKIQRASVCLFAAALGYVYDIFSEMDGGSFHKANGSLNNKMNTISFAKMQEYHNTEFMPPSYNNKEEELNKAAIKLDLPAESLHNAVEAKLVKRTYFQVIGKKRLSVQKYIISFA